MKLSVTNMEMILNTLVYDGKVERILAGDGSNLYRAIQPLLDSPGLIRTPCGLCPVRYIINKLYYIIFIIKIIEKMKRNMN